jgi:EAL domain-containing protein (putative c-di-GMP-specific phosphodiesterase class I)/GGDEF domain-containing protein
VRRAPPFSAFHFRRLQTRLTVLYAALFGAVLLVLAVTLQIVISANARTEVGGELQSSGAVFQRVWALQAERLQQGAELLAADFGFRQAVATGDEATTQSALVNLRGRLHTDRALILKPDGSILGGGAERDLDPQKLIAALDPQSPSSGVLVLNGQPFLAVAAPILAPDPQGWLIFALKLGRPELNALERTASIPINADIAGAVSDRPNGKLNDLVRQALNGRAAKPTELTVYGAPALILVRRLNGLGGGRGVGLVLSYPLAKALAPYQHLRDIVVLTGLLGGALLVIGGGFVARGVTRPVRALDAAAQALREGDTADLAVEGRDELARLATSFNLMAQTIREREAHITHLAYSDSETGLANRRALQRAVELRLQGQGHDRFAVAVLLIDRFSHVRGAIGHELSHKLVAEVGGRLMQLGCADVARLATASLGMTFPCESEAQAYAHLEALAGAMRASFSLADALVDITVTAGFTLCLSGEIRPETLIERASIAVDQAATSFRRTAAYDAAAYGDPARNLSLMSELMEAMGSEHFNLAYQPKYDLRRGLITGVEALSRWRHVTRGPLSPDLFVTMAEETGHIGEMTDWVLDKAMADQATFAAGGQVLDMSVNLSGRLLADDRFMHRALERMSGRAGRLCLEITETAVIDNPERARRNMELLAEAGVTISIDDYGSGLSSLAYLRDIRAEELKIDKAFVLRMDVAAKDALLVRSTVDMAHSLGLKVTAEGVETPATLALLTGMGCDMAQGYFIAKPMAAADLMLLLKPSPELDRPSRKIHESERKVGN